MGSERQPNDGVRVFTSAELARLGAFARSGDWARLQRAVAAQTFVRQERGDIAEHSLEVAMVITNAPAPKLAGLEAKLVIDSLVDSGLLLFLQRIARRGLVMRRVQINRMTVGDANHWHLDTDDDPDYSMAAILYLSSAEDYVGGDLLIEGGPEGGIRATLHSLVVFPADLPHALSPVSRALCPRISLIMLLGDNLAPNRRFSGGPV